MRSTSSWQTANASPVPGGDVRHEGGVADDEASDAMPDGDQGSPSS